MTRWPRKEPATTGRGRLARRAAKLLVWQNPGGAQIAAGAAAVLLGAWLGCLAFWLEER